MDLLNDQLFTKLGDVSSECFFVFDKTSACFQYLGPAVSVLLERHIDKTTDLKELLAMVHPEDSDYLRSQFYELDVAKKLTTEFRIIASSGTKYVQLIAYEIAYGKVAGWANNTNNIKKNILYAQKINARKNSLLEILAHDLKEPIGMINMMASAVKGHPTVAGNAVIESYIRTIQQLCESNIRLIRSIVSQEYLEAQEIDLRLERTDLAWSVRDVMQQYQTSAPLINKQFVFISKFDSLFVVMDTLKLIQVLNNLISNAIKFTADGGLIEVRLAELGDNIRLTVSDNGIGIPVSLRPSLFQPHSRSQRLGLRGEAGSGMGLSIVKTIVELHGGRVWHDADENTGATFHIEIPKER